MSKAWLLAALIVCGGMGVGHAHPAQSPASADPSLALPSVDDYPLHDGSTTYAYLHDRQRDVAARRLAKAPYDPDTLRLLIQLRQYDDVLAILDGIADTPPRVMASLLEALGSRTRELLSEKARNYDTRLSALVDRIQNALPRFDREEQAEVARQLVTLQSELDESEPRSWYARLRRFVQAYAGTRAATLTEVDLLNEDVSQGSIVALEAFARERPGTEAAAKALYLVGFNLGHNAFVLGERAGADPTDRFFRVLEISRELRSGKYPPCEWVDKAIELPIHFFAYQPKYAPGNPERILAALEDLLPELLRLPRHPSRPDPGYVVGSRMGELFKAAGGGLPQVESLFDRLAAGPHRDQVLLAKAEYYLRPSEGVVDPKDWPSLRPKAAVLLERLVREGSGLPQRKALATLATLRFVDREYAAASRLYEEFLSRYPESSYAWLAAVRVGMSAQALGKADDAIEAYRRAASQFASVPVAVTLANAYAGRVSEGDGRFAEALAFYRSALTGWPDGQRDRVSAWPYAPPGGFPDPVDRRDTTRVWVASRVDELARSLDDPGGALVERARWLISRERWNESLEPLAAFLKAHTGSRLLPEVRALAHRARLELALALVDADGETIDAEGAAARLRELLAEPPGFEVCAAGIALATLEALREDAGDPDEQMRRALERWKALDAARPRAAADPLRADVIEIRNVVFQPDGGGVFRQGSARWNAFRWEAAPYKLVNPDLRIKHADGTVTTMTVTEPFPGLESILFLDGTRRAVLERLMLKLGGTKRNPWTRVMDTPNQPAGPSLAVQALWKRFFFVQPGHWGGWVFETYPIIGEIEFVDAARTKAAVKVKVGYSGATVQMEKRDGTWIATELTNFWIT